MKKALKRMTAAVTALIMVGTGLPAGVGSTVSANTGYICLFGSSPLTASTAGESHSITLYPGYRIADGNQALSEVTADKTSAKAGDTVTLTVNTAAGEIPREGEFNGFPMTGGLCVAAISEAGYQFPELTKSGNHYTFVMPDNDVAIAAYFDCVDYTVGFVDLDYYIEHGEFDYGRYVVDSSNSNNELKKADSFSPAHVGDTIRVGYHSFGQSEKYVIKSMYYSYVDENGEITNVDVPVINADDGNVIFVGEFTMPAYDVSIGVEYQGAHSVSIDSTAGRALERDKWAAVEGETVTLTQEEGYEIRSITVKCGETAIPVTSLGSGKYTFTMPDGDVMISADAEHKYYYNERRWDASSNEVVSSDKNFNLSSVQYLTPNSTWLGSGVWYFVNSDITISDRITIGGTANIILADGATLNCPKGIAVNAGNTLNIYGQTNDTGKLVAGSDSYEAAIGSDDQDDDSGENGGGTINIYGGTIKATAGDDSAGIGGGNEAGNGNITIYGGNVTAQGGDNGAGIGSGDEPETNIGAITIYGGEITSTGGKCGAGIGGGCRAVPSSVDIYGGKINAFGGRNAAGIGAGFKHNSDAFTITIHNAEKVYAKGNGHGAGIGESADVNTGSGYQSSSSTVIRIDGGTVEAHGGGNEAYVDNISAAAGIGGGATMNTRCNIIITGGDISAFGGEYPGDTWSAEERNQHYFGAAGIGAGASGDIYGGDFDGSVKIQGGTVKVRSSGSVYKSNISFECFGAAAIGAGCHGNMRGTIEIKGGTVAAEGISGGAAIGAGSESMYGSGGECEGSISISGGTLKLKITNFCDNSDPAEDISIIGRGMDGSEDGTLALGTDMMVHFENETPYSKILRTMPCRTSSSKTLIIEPCVHADETYTSTNTHHTASCRHCFTVFPAKLHYMDSNNHCTVCGYQGALYSISFDADGGSGTMENVSVVPNADYTLPECGFTAPEGNGFRCWSVNGTDKSAGDNITVNGNTVIKAVWETVYTVTFDTNGGSDIPAQTVAEGGKVKMPDAPEKNGYIFDGWYRGDTAFDFSETVTGDITLTAQWRIRESATLNAANITLGGELGLNFYVTVPDEAVSAGAKAIMHGPEGEKEVLLSSLTKDDKGRYKVTYKIKAVYMDKNVSLNVADSENNMLNLFKASGPQVDNNTLVYSIYDYVQSAKADTALTEKEHRMVDTMYTYGAYSAKWFNGTDLPADVNILNDLTVSDYEAYKLRTDGSSDSITLTGLSLILDSNTALRLYFTSADDISGHSAKVEDIDLVIHPTETAGKYYVEIDDISANNLISSYSIVFDGNYTAAVSAMTYVYDSLINGTTEDVMNILKALCAYSDAVNKS